MRYRLCSMEIARTRPRTGTRTGTRIGAAALGTRAAEFFGSSRAAPFSHRKKCDPRFSLGRLVSTPGALAAVPAGEMLEALGRHSRAIGASRAAPRARTARWRRETPGCGTAELFPREIVFVDRRAAHVSAARLTRLLACRRRRRAVPVRGPRCGARRLLSWSGTRVVGHQECRAPHREHRDDRVAPGAPGGHRTACGALSSPLLQPALTSACTGIQRHAPAPHPSAEAFHGAPVDALGRRAEPWSLSRLVERRPRCHRVVGRSTLRGRRESR